MIVSAVGYFFSIIAVFTTIMAFMMLLIGVLNPSTFEKVRHYPHPRPIIEQKVPPTNPATSTNPEPRHARVALGTNEATPAAPPPSQKRTPKAASLNEKSDPKGLWIFINSKSGHVNAGTMRDTATGWLQAMPKDTTRD